MNNHLQATLTPEQQARLAAAGQCARPELIRRLMIERGLTQNGLSRAHDIPLTTINATIHGWRKHPATRALLVELLDMPEAVLFGVAGGSATTGRGAGVASAGGGRESATA